jgi:hypothetical protein
LKARPTRACRKIGENSIGDDEVGLGQTVGLTKHVDEREGFARKLPLAELDEPWRDISPEVPNVGGANSMDMLEQVSSTTPEVEQRRPRGASRVCEHVEHHVVTLCGILCVWPVYAAVRIAVCGETRFIVCDDVKVASLVFAHKTPQAAR